MHKLDTEEEAESSVDEDFRAGGVFLYWIVQFLILQKNQRL